MIKDSGELEIRSKMIDLSKPLKYENPKCRREPHSCIPRAVYLELFGLSNKGSPDWIRTANESELN